MSGLDLPLALPFINLASLSLTCRTGARRVRRPMASPTPPLDVDLAACRPRRFSLLPLPTSSAPRPPRRSSQRTQSLSLPATRDNSALPSTVPLAFPPYMPMLKPPTPGSPARLVKAPSSPSTTSRRPASGLEEDLWNEPPSTPPRRMHVPASSPAKTPSHTPTRDGSSSRLRRRLQRWTRSRDLDFGCAGDWSEGPADMVRLRCCAPSVAAWSSS